jgi:dTDP-4-dehydrorhamnose reductase
MAGILVTGATGQLGAYLLREFGRQGTPFTAWGGPNSAGETCGFPVQAVDLANPDEAARAFDAAQPTVAIHAAAIARIDLCHRDPELAERVNTAGTRALVELCRRTHARLVYVSTDLVFDGQRGGYQETDPPSPLSIYGKTKAAGEAPVREYEAGVVVRTSLMFGPPINGRPNFFQAQVRSLESGSPMTLFVDEWRTPLSFHAAARGLVAIAESDCYGLLHLGGPQRMSRYEMGQQLAAALGRDASVFRPARQADIPASEPRPRDVSLDSSRFRRRFPGVRWPEWNEALDAMGIGGG